MGGLRPIGSEKLEGMDKIRRMIEIARYNESIPKPVNEDKKTEYTAELADGRTYSIVREKLGYIIKESFSEDVYDYIEPIQNRKYFNSYSQALKKLNLMAKEFNQMYGNEEGMSLFTEQKKKFKLRLPSKKKAETLEPAAETPPPPVESTPQPMDSGTEQLPPPVDAGASDMGAEQLPPPVDAGASDMGSEELPPPVDAGADDMGDDSKLPEPPSDEDEEQLPPPPPEGGEMTEYNELGEIASLKDAINGGIAQRYSGEMQKKMTEFKEEDEYGRHGARQPRHTYNHFSHGTFGESKVDKIISQYFTTQKKEIISEEKKKIQKIEKYEKIKETNYSNIKNLSESIRQERMALKYMEKNPVSVLVGKTNKGSLVFKEGVINTKITINGLVI